MRYQLVLQFPGDSLVDYDAIIALENQLIFALGSSAKVDGHDCGAGECNIFVHTNHPAATFHQALSGLERIGVLSSLRAAYRPIDGEDYTVLWPEDHSGDFVLA